MIGFPIFFSLPPTVVFLLKETWLRQTNVGGRKELVFTKITRRGWLEEDIRKLDDSSNLWVNRHLVFSLLPPPAEFSLPPTLFPSG